MMRVLVDPRFNTFHDIVEEEFPVAPPLRWMAAPAGLTRQWRFDDKKFTPPTAPDAADAERARVASIEEAASVHIAAVIPPRDREMIFAGALVVLDRARRGRPLNRAENTRMDEYMARLDWVRTVHEERDAAIAAGTPADAVTFTAWPGG